MALYQLYGITKTHGGHTVLSIPELVLEEGRTSCLLGPNGSGKTTLLELLAFLTKPTSGRMVYRSRPVNHSTPRLQLLRREVVLVEQHPILFSTNVFHNVEFGLRARKIESLKRRRVVEESLELVGMREFINVRRHRLSGGETQRLAIARALACTPRVILFDEPTASVDLENQLAIERIIRDVVAEKKTTVVFTTHDQDQASRLADIRIFLLGGSPMGSEYHNLINGRIETADDGTKKFAVNGGFRLPLESDGTGPVRACIDPRKLKIHSWDKEYSEQVDATEFTRGRLVQLAEEREEIRAVVDTSVPVNVLISKEDFKRMKPRIGDEVLLQFLPGSVKLLETD